MQAIYERSADDAQLAVIFRLTSMTWLFQDSLVFYKKNRGCP
jgi:hypothetical protein